MFFFYSKCGELQAGQTLEYETSNNKEYNIMMFKFNSQFITNRNPTRGFFMVLMAFTAGIIVRFDSIYPTHDTLTFLSFIENIFTYIP